MIGMVVARCGVAGWRIGALVESDDEAEDERYISLLTDFGFKRIFGSAPNKDLLICFLNSLLTENVLTADVKLSQLRKKLISLR